MVAGFLFICYVNMNFMKNMEWKKATKTIVGLSGLSKDIVVELEEKWENYFLENYRIIKSNKKKTEKLFEFLTELGNNKGYKVYSHSLSKEFIERNKGIFVNREWLFDLCWYTEKGHGYLLKSLDLAVEAEWSNKRKEDKDQYGGVKYDFQKLLVANMGLCLMVFQVTKEGREKLSKYFEEVCNLYECNKTEFLFIAFSRKEKTFYYSYLPKRGKNV